jgi:hypothetical protein
MTKPGGTFNYALGRWIEPKAKVLPNFSRYDNGNNAI